MNSVEDRRQAFEREIDDCKSNIELIFDEYSRILKNSNELLTEPYEIKGTRDVVQHLGKTYINADNLLKNKDDWSNDVILEFQDCNRHLRRWIHRREDPSFDKDNSIEILEGLIFRVSGVTEHLVDAVKDAETAHLSQEA